MMVVVAKNHQAGRTQKVDSSYPLSGKIYVLKPSRADQGPNRRDVRPSELIEHIVKKHHVYLWRELTELSRTVTDMCRAHGAAYPELAELHIRFHQMKDEIEQHMIAEEETIFPRILKAERTGSQADCPETVQSIGVLETEHDEVTSMLRAIRDITLDGLLPEKSRAMYHETFRRLEELESDIREHIRLENKLLFPKYREFCGKS